MTFQLIKLVALIDQGNYSLRVVPKIKFDKQLQHGDLFVIMFRSVSNPWGILRFLAILQNNQYQSVSPPANVHT